MERATKAGSGAATGSPEPAPKTRSSAQVVDKVVVEVSYDLLAASVKFEQNGAPTVALRSALEAALHCPAKFSGTPTGSARHVRVEWDPIEDRGEVVSDAGSFVARGIIATALAMVNQNQIMQRITHAAVQARGGKAS